MNDPVNIAIEARANMFAWGQVKPKTSPTEKGSIFTTVAPYYNTPITSENAKEVRDKVEKDFKEKANSIASSLGITIRNVSTNVGGFEFQEGEAAGQQVTELSYTFELETDDTFLADTFAYLLGELGYERQEAVISANYVSNSEDANAIELSIKVKSNAGVLEALKRAGITDYTIDLSNKTIKILGFDLDNTTELEEKLDKIQQELGDNYERVQTAEIQSRYIDREAKRDIQEKWKATLGESSQNRQLHSYLTQAENNEDREYEEAVKSGRGLLQEALNLFKGRKGGEYKDSQSNEGKTNEGKGLRDGIHEEAYPRGKRQYLPRE